MTLDDVRALLVDLAVYILAGKGLWYICIGRARWERELDDAEKRLHHALFEEDPR